MSAVPSATRRDVFFFFFCVARGESLCTEQEPSALKTATPPPPLLPTPPALTHTHTLLWLTLNAFALSRLAPRAAKGATKSTGVALLPPDGHPSVGGSRLFLFFFFPPCLSLSLSLSSRTLPPLHPLAPHLSSSAPGRSVPTERGQGCIMTLTSGDSPGNGIISNALPGRPASDNKYPRARR